MLLIRVLSCTRLYSSCYTGRLLSAKQTREKSLAFIHWPLVASTTQKQQAIFGVTCQIQARLAVDLSVRGKGLGADLLHDAVLRWYCGVTKWQKILACVPLWCMCSQTKLNVFIFTTDSKHLNCRSELCSLGFHDCNEQRRSMAKRGPHGDSTEYVSNCI